MSITCFWTPYGVYHTYHNNMILFDSASLEDLISEPVSEDLEERIKLWVPHALLFVKTWYEESEIRVSSLKSWIPKTYKEYFKVGFGLIQDLEPDFKLKMEAEKIYSKIKPLLPYLGPYKDYDNIMKTSDVMGVLMLIYWLRTFLKV